MTTTLPHARSVLPFNDSRRSRRCSTIAPRSRLKSSSTGLNLDFLSWGPGNLHRPTASAPARACEVILGHRASGSTRGGDLPLKARRCRLTFPRMDLDPNGTPSSPASRSIKARIVSTGDPVGGHETRTLDLRPKDEHHAATVTALARYVVGVNVPGSAAASQEKSFHGPS